MNSKLFLLCVSMVFVSVIKGEMHSYYPTKGTADQIVACLWNQTKGSYLSFTNEEIIEATSGQMNAFKGELREACALCGSHVFQGISLLCKGLNVFHQQDGEGMNTQQCYELINRVKSCGYNSDDIFATNILSMLMYKDPHYCFRLCRLIGQSRQLIGVLDNKYVDRAQQLFDSDITNFTLEDIRYEQISDLEQMICKEIRKDSGFKIVLIAGGARAKILAKRILKKNLNVFIFDVGTFIEDLNVLEPDRALGMLTGRSIKVVYTAAVLKKRFQERKDEYLNSLNILRKFWYDPYIIEACTTKSFFDSYSQHVVYSQVNNASLKNKGVNEANSIKEGIKGLPFKSNDLIVKLTGRYFFKDEFFLRLIESTPEYDGYVTLDPRSHFSFSGCFGLRYDYFKRLVDEINFGEMEHNMIDFERIVLDYMKKIERENGAKILYLDEIGVYANVNHIWKFHW